jgi:hypothetical protein
METSSLYAYRPRNEACCDRSCAFFALGSVVPISRQMRAKAFDNQGTTTAEPKSDLHLGGGAPPRA